MAKSAKLLLLEAEVLHFWENIQIWHFERKIFYI